MSPVAAAHDIERPASLFGPAPQPSPAPAVAATLEQALGGAWNELRRRAVTSCLLCGGRVQARWGAGPAPVAGRCEDCGTELL